MMPGPVRFDAAPPHGSAGGSLGAKPAALDPVLDFLEFIDAGRDQPLRTLLQHILLKARQLTDAEAGSIFIIRGRGGQRYLEPGSLQNDAIKLSAKRFFLPISKESIAGYVATTGETLFIEDLYNIPAGAPYIFRQETDRSLGYRSRTMLAFPLTNGKGAVVAVVQLINRRPAGGDRILPFEPSHAALIAPVNHFAGRAIERAEMTEAILEKNRRLREQSRTIAALQAQTEDAFMLSIRLLAKAAELHDEVTGNHILRVNEYSYALARHAGQKRAWCDEIRYSAQLHDVGKMSVDAAVLKKKGKLTSEEWEEMRRHPVYGFEILRVSPRLQMAADIARCHHEKWDGTGYPAGLRGEEIPFSARIVAIADIYDALRSSRPYKEGFSHDAACRIILEGDERIDPAKHFDPFLLETFAAHPDEMGEIWESLQDPAHPAEAAE
jgi:HD-GYP domain-containing protein (c-di-GMP phosphodiesterase class II)